MKSKEQIDCYINLYELKDYNLKIVKLPPNSTYLVKIPILTEVPSPSKKIISRYDWEFHDFIFKTGKSGKSTIDIFNFIGKCYDELDQEDNQFQEDNSINDLVLINVKVDHKKLIITAEIDWN